MNTQTAAKAHPQRNGATKEKTVSNINSTDALNMIEHGSDMTIGITTPVGTTFRCSTAFIGTHSDNLILIEVPKISDDDLSFFFQAGFWLTVRAISPRGEGALVHFRSQLQHVIKEPIAMITMSIPNSMQVTQLRKEPRYDVNLNGRLIFGGATANCEVRDLSKSGCRFITPPLGRTYQVGDIVSIELGASSSSDFEPLTGRVCNLQRSTHYSRYGLEFDALGRDNAKSLLSKLKFNGTKLTLKR